MKKYCRCQEIFTFLFSKNTCHYILSWINHYLFPLLKAPLWVPAYAPRVPALIMRKNRNTRQTGQKKVKVQSGKVRQKNTLMSIFPIADNLLNNHKPNATWLFTALMVHFCRGHPNTVATSGTINLPKHGCLVSSQIYQSFKSWGQVRLICHTTTEKPAPFCSGTRGQVGCFEASTMTRPPRIKQINTVIHFS